MACFSPLKAWPIGTNPSGKTKLLVTSYSVDHIERLPDGCFERCLLPEHVYKSFDSDIITAFETVPCGSCIGCRLERSKQWSYRCLLEMQYHDSSMFLTLTYDDDHIPTGEGVDPNTGEVLVTHSLVKEDWQKFMKRLRKAYSEKLRFFMCGEYGDHTARPHFHAIVFGLKLDDLVPYKKVGDYWYYNSKFLSDLWSYGFVVVGEASMETAAYTARYCTKKLYKEDSFIYSSLNLEPPFTLMSRKPGIGLSYMKDHFDSLQDDPFINIATDCKGVKFRVPKYFKRKYDEIFENNLDFDMMNKRAAEKRRAKDEMETAKQLKCLQSDMSYLDLLASDEVLLKSKLKKLERSL